MGSSKEERVHSSKSKSKHTSLRASSLNSFPQSGLIVESTGLEASARSRSGLSVAKCRERERECSPTQGPRRPSLELEA